MLFCLTWRPPAASNSLNMKQLNLMNTNIWTAGLTLGGRHGASHRLRGAAGLNTCPCTMLNRFTPASRPILLRLRLRPNSGAGAAPAGPTADWQQPPPAPAPAPLQPPPQTVVVANSAPPPAPVEVIPIAPGPTYVWAPGYYAWNGGWVWVGGRYVVRPRPGVVWVGGHWGRHGRGYVWIGGGWR